MPPPGETTLPATRRIRKSIGIHTDARKAADKENATIDLGNTRADSMKSRSKSLGPGGFDALKLGSGNRRASLAAPPRTPRSILKPTLGALKEIPPLGKKRSSSGVVRSSTPSGSDDQNKSTVALRTEEEQQAAAREREERERRDARRKSLANRRVSFAAEATLHTFHDIDYLQDSTASTDSTRRASSAAAKSRDGQETDHGAGQGRRDSTVTDYGHIDSEDRGQPHGNQRRSFGFPPPANFHAQDNLTSSTIYSSDSEPADLVEELVSEDEMEGSSSDSDDGTMVTVVTEDMTGSSIGSIGSIRSDDDAEDSSTLDEALRLAAQRASTQNLDEDDEQYDDDAEGEEVIPSFGWIKKRPRPSAGGPSAQAPSPGHDTIHSDGSGMDMDLTAGVGNIIRSGNDASSEQGQDDDMSMDVTRVVGGGIIHQQPSLSRPSHPDNNDGSPSGDQTMDFTMPLGGIRQPQFRQAAESDDNDDNEDMSMEFTTAIGDIMRSQNRQSVGPSRRTTLRANNESEPDTTSHSIGGMSPHMGRIILSAAGNRVSDADTTVGMDMTVPLGNILISNSDNGRDESNRQSFGGRIAPEDLVPQGSPRKSVREAELVQSSPERRSSSVQSSSVESSPMRLSPIRSSPVRSSPMRPSPVKNTQPSLSENGDPGLWAFRGKGLRRSIRRDSSSPYVRTPDSRTPSPRKPSPRKPSPQKIETSKSNPVSTPTKTPTPQTSQRVTRSASRSASKSASPQKLPSSPPTADTLSPERTRRESPPSGSNVEVGTTTPTVTVPQHRSSGERRLSGVGADRSGLGSPRVAEIFDRRESIGDTATDFIPGKRVVSFEDPKAMAEEVDRERQVEGGKENPRAILEREAYGLQEDADATFNLKEMIESLSPIRNPLKGRKSLHVGSARGLLGKRPAELDNEDEDEDDEDAEERDGVKRLKGHQGSPVKKIRLHNPPSMAETTGRHTRLSQPGLEHPNSTPILSSPTKGSAAKPIKNQYRFRSFEDESTTREIDFGGSPSKDASELEKEADDGRIHLQQFLDMTSIRFMELTTTKRRHTTAPNAFTDDGLAGGQDDISLEARVVTGACTVPTLELYQHSCRELKKYISEGRRVVKEIELDTFRENPPLFREYMTAGPDVKALMDNQFKIVKTHARLISKSMWYEWRMKLQEGLKEGLISISEGMSNDNRLLQKQQDLLSSVLPAAVSRCEALQEESANLEEASQELADSDPAELHAARDELVSLDDDMMEKKKRIAELRRQLEESEAEVDGLTAKKADCQADIRESEKIREDCRGWTSAEINTLRDRVEALEREHGWAVTGISGTTLSMTYQREIELVFDIASFQPGQPNSRIDLWYIGGNEDAATPMARTAETEFFVDCIRDCIRALPQNETPLSRLLNIVRAGWDKARHVADQIRHVNITFPTTVVKTSDSSVAVTSSIMLMPLQTRVEITWGLNGGSGHGGEDVHVGIESKGKVIYGESFNVDKMGEFLSTLVGDSVQVGGAEWSDALVELKGKLIARGRKGARP